MGITLDIFETHHSEKYFGKSFMPPINPKPNEIKNYETVPELEKILFSLL